MEIKPKFEVGQKVALVSALLSGDRPTIYEIKELKIKHSTEGTWINYYTNIGSVGSFYEGELVAIDEIPEKVIELQQEKIKELLENGMKTINYIKNNYSE